MSITYAYIYYEGLEGATSVTASSAASGFPDDNLQDRNQNTLWKAGGTGTVTITIDYGTTVSPTAVALVNNNLYSATGDNSIRLVTETDDDNTWDGTLEYHVGSSGSAHAAASGDEPIWLETFSEPTARRYWRLYIYNCDSGVHYIGAIILSETLTLNPQFDRPADLASIYGVDTFETSGGHRFTNKLHDERMRWNLKWTYAGGSFKEDVLTFWRSVEGSRYPFVYKDRDGALYWVACVGASFPHTESQHELWSFSMTLEEEF